jgi:pimeloyl-ACP methyl ester carboxylesterase
MKTIFFLAILFLAATIIIQAEEVTVLVNDYTISGTLEIPKSDKPIDVALIIAGSGPTDRDGNNPLIPGKNNSLKMLADLLYENGIASLRYDKRGIGANDKVNESELTFDTYINDAVELVKYLKKDKRFSKIIIIGHSEGSLIGMITVERIDVNMFISICGAGQPAYSLIEEQLKNSNLPEELLNNSLAIMDSLKLGITVKNVDPSLSMQFRPSIQSYMLSWFKYNPAKEISKLTIPILIIQGTTDIQVDVKDAELLSQANKNSKLVVIENMNHVLKEVTTLDKIKNYQSYSNSDLPLSETFSKTVINFIKQ